MTAEVQHTGTDRAPDYANRLARAALPSILTAVFASFVAFVLFSIFGTELSTTLQWMIVVAMLGGGGCYIGMFFVVRSHGE